MSVAMDVLAGLEATTLWQEKLYKDLHQHPELSMQEVRTRGVIRQRLESFGYATQEIGGGVVGVLFNGEGPTVLVRADIDALPVTEATGLDYASATVGVMHACGHDTHIVCGLGAAELLSQGRDAWAGTYITLFQPGEETAAGARAMVGDGLVGKIPRPTVCLAQHVLGSPEAGHVATTAGPVLSAADSLRITVHGKGSHGSMPHLGVDPVVLAASIVVRLQTIVSRVLAPDEFGVVTVGSLQSGSTANIIPDRAELLVNVRTYDPDVRERVIAAIERIVRSECEAAGSPQDPEFASYDTFPLTDNDAEPTAIVTAAFRQHFGEDRVHHMAPATASEDFSVIPDAFGVPYTY
ncbi:amidohydrolase [Ornithinimicrobium cavernae]|uniref:amidohydrolase n=1 Tax=Ornithinimicrobium cavernae TaxID=2666047 RepID=UPI00301CF4D0